MQQFSKKNIKKNSDEEIQLSVFEFLNLVITIDVIRTLDNLLDDLGLTKAVRKTGEALDAGSEVISTVADKIGPSLLGKRKPIVK